MRRTLGLAGGSCSGKGCIADEIIHFLGDELLVLRLDDYYRDHSRLDDAARAAINYDEPAAFEVDLLAMHLDVLLEGNDIEVPVYNFTTHRRETVTRRVSPRPWILLEGILVLSIDEIRERCCHTVFVDAAEGVRLERRLDRDTVERGRHPDDIRRQFREQVGPMHDLWIEPSAEHADVRIDGTLPPSVTARRIVESWTAP